MADVLPQILLIGTRNAQSTTWRPHRTLLNSPGVYAGIVLVLGITGVHEVLLRRLEQKVAAYRQS